MEKNYESLRVDVLQRLIDERGIPYKPSRKEKETKTTIIELLKLDDSGKYQWDLTYEKSDGGYVVGVGLNDHKRLHDIGKMIEKKESKNINQFYDNRVHFWVSQKLV